MPRGRWEQEDRRHRERLLASGKDRAENVMIVDLLRNDLGRVARFGTVQVERLFEIERFETVWQMTSTVAADTRPGTRLFDIFAAMFPCGSVTGAPKARDHGDNPVAGDLPARGLLRCDRVAGAALLGAAKGRVLRGDPHVGGGRAGRFGRVRRRPGVWYTSRPPRTSTGRRW